MDFEKITIVIDDYLQEVNDNQTERIERIKQMQDFLAYNLRLTGLTTEEKEDFVNTMQGGNVTDGMKKTLSDYPTEEKKDYYLTMWARSNYFRQCAWMGYLHGTEKKMPFVQLSERKVEE